MTLSYDRSPGYKGISQLVAAPTEIYTAKLPEDDGPFFTHEMKTHGYINTASLLHVWSRKKMHTLRRDIIANKVSKPRCSGCEYPYQDAVS